MQYRVLFAPAVLIALVIGAGAGTAHAVEVYIPVAINSTTASFQGGMVAGTRYTATQNVTYNSLGFIDVDSSSDFNFYNTPNGLVGSYQVGIWLNSTQQLLASATVTPSSPLGAIPSQFRYAPIAPTTILAGQDFTVGALLPAGPLPDAWLSGDISVNYVGITGPGSGYFVTGNTLSFPTQNGLDTFAVANASTQTVVPEPGTLTLLGTLIGAGLLRRRR